jgi:hypothetical protein
VAVTSGHHCGIMVTVPYSFRSVLGSGGGEKTRRCFSIAAFLRHDLKAHNPVSPILLDSLTSDRRRRRRASSREEADARNVSVTSSSSASYQDRSHQIEGAVDDIDSEAIGRHRSNSPWCALTPRKASRAMDAGTGLGLRFATCSFAHRALTGLSGSYR